MSADDPRDFFGDISGPGGPYDIDGVVIDDTNAILLDTTTVAQVSTPIDGRSFTAMLLAGRVNRSEDLVQVLFLFDPDGAAAIITELHGIARRAGWNKDLLRLCEERWKEMP